MKYTVAVSVAALAVIVGVAVWGCQQPPQPKTTGPSLAGIRPETRETLKQVMVKVGKYYRQLEGDVADGNLLDAAVRADAIADLGAYLAPYRDPGMPQEYIVRQAPFDAAARELALAARLNQAKEIGPLLAEMRSTCQNCHQTFQVSLPDFYRELGFGGQGGNTKEASGHGR